MEVTAIKTRKLVPPKDDLYGAIRESLPTLSERSVVVVTSKVLAIHQGRCIRQESGIRNNELRDALTRDEADWFVKREIVPGEHLLFSIKNNTLIASAGIDKSNANGYFVLWSEHMDEMARELQGWLKTEYGAKEVGVLITDSHVVPLRRGVVGTCL